MEPLDKIWCLNWLPHERGQYSENILSRNIYMMNFEMVDKRTW